MEEQDENSSREDPRDSETKSDNTEEPTEGSDTGQRRSEPTAEPEETTDSTEQETTEGGARKIDPPGQNREEEEEEEERELERERERQQVGTERSDRTETKKEPETEARETSDRGREGGHSPAEPKHNQDHEEPDRREDVSEREKTAGPETGTGTGTDEGTESESTETRVDDEVVALRDEVSGLRDRLDELETEFEEYKKVSERKRQEIKEHGISEFATRMLKIQSTLHNAIELEDFSEDTEQRMNMVLNQFEQVYTSGKIKKIETDGVFDERKHKAVEVIEGTEHAPEQILEVREPGYRMGEKIIRPAHVVVTK